MKIKSIVSLLKTTASQWSDDKAPRLSAALAYYTIFSLAPLLIIAVGVSGLVFGEAASRGEIVKSMGGLVGDLGAKSIQAMIENARKPEAGIFATAIGVLTLFLGASGVFAELQDSLNTIWGVKPKSGRPIRTILRQRVITFGMVLGIAFLLLVSLVVTAALSALGSFFQNLFPISPVLWQVVNLGVSLGITSLLFAMIYKILPDVKVAWGDVWIGSFVTAVLFTIGKFLIGYYLGSGSVGSVYGAAGSLAILLVWVYYSALIFVFGAEFTQVYANRYGSHIVPKADAVLIPKPAEIAKEYEEKAS